MGSQVFPKFLLHHRFVIGPVAEVHLCHRVAFEYDEVGADAVNAQASLDVFNKPDIFQ